MVKTLGISKQRQQELMEALKMEKLRECMVRKEQNQERRRGSCLKLTCDICMCGPVSQPTLSCSVLAPRVDTAMLAQSSTVKAAGSHLDHGFPQQRDLEDWSRDRDAHIPPQQLTK